MKHRRERKPRTASFRSLTIVVLLTLIARVLCANDSDGGVSFRDSDVGAKTPMVNNTIESESAISYNVERYTGDVYNPVLQNFSAFEHSMQMERERQLSSKHGDISRTDPHGTRNKRSLTSLRCGRRRRCRSSLCPWGEQMDIQSTRSPPIIKYAVCMSRNCDFNFANLDQNVNNILEVYTTCEYLRTDIRVLEDGQEKWLTDWPIACICTCPHVESADDMILRRTHASSGRSYVGLSKHARRLVLHYKLQQRRRQNVESFEALMRRRRSEKNNS